MLKKLVTVTRSGSIESEHYGVGAIVNSEGKILKAVSYTHLRAHET